MKTRTRKALAIAAVAPAILILAACRGEIIYKIEEDGSGAMLIEIEDTTGDLTMYGVTCDDVLGEPVTDDLFGITEDDQADITIEDISGEYLACRMSVTTSQSMVDGELLIDNGDTFTFITEADPTADFTDEMPPGVDYEFTVTIEMPGPIIEATNGGEVNGNRVTYDLFEAAQNGFEVTANKSDSGTGGGTTGTGGEGPGGGGETGQGGEELGEGSDEDSDTGAAPVDDDRMHTTDAEDSDDEGFPMWAWFAIGGGAIVIISLVSWMIARGKKNKNQPGPYGPGGVYGGGYPPQGGQYAGPAGAYGAPQAGQHNTPGGQSQNPQGRHYGQHPPQPNPNYGGQPPHSPSRQPPRDPNSGPGQWS